MHDFGKIVAPTMCELFVRRLADMILSGELRVGEHLPPERQMAEQMGVSKSVAHSGLAELARIGLVTIKPQSGTYVADYMVTGNLETFNAIVRFNGNHLDADTVAAIFDFRLAVEGFALRRLAKCRTQADVAALRADIERIGDDIASGAMTYTGLAERFQQFHLRICQCSRSAMLPLTMNAVREGSIALWERYLRTAGLESAVNLLTQFVDAIERQDGNAAYALLEQGLDRQLTYYQAQAKPNV